MMYAFIKKKYYDDNMMYAFIKKKYYDDNFSCKIFAL